MTQRFGFRFTPPGGELTLDRVPWEGGPAYYTVAQNGAKMTNAEASGWAEDTFFPIGVFLAKGDTTSAEQYLALNFNTYLCIQGPASNIGEATDVGFSVIAQYDEWTPTDVAGNTGVVAWGWDEPEFNIGSVATYEAQIDTARARADGRFMWTNWGVGAIHFPTPFAYDPTYADIVGVDQYTYTSPFVREHFHTGIEFYEDGDWPGPTGDDAWTRKAATYGYQADRINEYQATNGSGANTCPNWVFFETKMPLLTESAREIALYAEMKGAVWAALIHEARGIQWFDMNGHYHNPPAEDEFTENDPNTGVAPNEGGDLLAMEQGCKDYVSQVNAQVLSLAPVLNTQSYVFDFGASTIDTMLKAKDGFAYIFAHVALGGSTGSKTFTLTGSGITGTTVEVVDESRSLNVTANQFTDSFANEYTYHIYKVTI